MSVNFNSAFIYGFKFDESDLVGSLDDLLTGGIEVRNFDRAGATLKAEVFAAGDEMSGDFQQFVGYAFVEMRDWTRKAETYAAMASPAERRDAIKAIDAVYHHIKAAQPGLVTSPPGFYLICSVS